MGNVEGFGGYVDDRRSADKVQSGSRHPEHVELDGDVLDSEVAASAKKHLAEALVEDPRTEEAPDHTEGQQ